MANLVVATANPLLTFPFVDADEALYGEAPSRKDLEIRVGHATPGSGTLVELRASTAYICEAERVGETISSMDSVGSWTGTGLATTATNPTGYSGTSVQWTPGSVANGGVASISRTPTAALGARLRSNYSGAVLTRIHARLSVLIASQTLRIRYAGTGWTADYTLGTLTAAYQEFSVAKQATLAASTGTPWSNDVTSILLIVANGSGGAASPVLFLRDLRIGTTMTGKTVPDGHLALESVYDIRARYGDAQAPTTWGAWSVWYQVKPSAPPALTVTSPLASPLASDAFGRTVVDGWGSADVGGAWTVSGTAADYDVASGVGTIVTGASTGRSAKLAGVTARDLDIVTTWKVSAIPTTQGAWSAIYIRNSVSNTYYRVLAYISAGTGNLSLSITPIVASVAQPDVAPTAWGPITANTNYRLRVQAVGASPTFLRVRHWLASNPEPTTWDIVALDSTASLQAATGYQIEVRADAIGNAPLTWTFDDHVATAAFRDPTLLVDYGYTSVKSQASRRLVLTDVTAGLVPADVYDSGTQAGATSDWTAAAGYLVDEHRYRATITATDTEGLSTTLSWEFVAAFPTPAAPATITITPDPATGSIGIAWDASTSSDVVGYYLERRADPDGAYVRIADGGVPGDEAYIAGTSATDYYAPNMVDVTYRVATWTGSPNLVSDWTEDSSVSPQGPAQFVVAGDAAHTFEVPGVTQFPATYPVQGGDRLEAFGRSTAISAKGLGLGAAGTVRFLLPPEDRWKVERLRELQGFVVPVILKDGYGFVIPSSIEGVSRDLADGGFLDVSVDYVQVEPA